MRIMRADSLRVLLGLRKGVISEFGRSNRRQVLLDVTRYVFQPPFGGMTRLTLDAVNLKAQPKQPDHFAQGCRGALDLELTRLDPGQRGQRLGQRRCADQLRRCDISLAEVS